MKTPPTLDYEAPKPRKRVGFLAKLNPKATWRSALRRAMTNCVVAAILWYLASVFHFNPKFQPDWGHFSLLMVCAVIVGIVWEWQIPPGEFVPFDDAKVDIRDDWSEEDMAELTRHSLNHADESESEKQIGK